MRSATAAAMSSKGEELYAATARGDDASVRALLDQGVDPDEWRNAVNVGETALHRAAKRRFANWDDGDCACARLLFEATANIEAKADDGATPLHVAAANAHTRMVWLLLDNGANVTARDKKGITPLHDAAIHSMAATIEALLLWGAGTDLESWNNGFEPGTPRDRASFHDKAVAFDAAVANARGLFWTRALHPRLPRPSREVVVTVLLCLRRVATAAVPGSALRRAVALPALPVELWEMILGMVRAVDLLPRRA